ncbi:MAG: cell division protein ZipA C-terminal FtsZ-binding domain-containing protein [Candidatus Berkiella sp.]
MQTDLQLLLLIIGLVFGGFILYNTFRPKGRKRQSSFEEFEQPTPKATQHKERHDPLLDEYEQDVMPLGKTVQSKPVLAEDVLLQPIKHQEMTEPKPLPLFEPEQELNHEPLFESPKPVKKKLTQPRKIQSEVIVFSIIPKNGIFTGSMLSAALKANHFHYGEQKIFHRHVEDNPKSPILFSVASLVEPGNFEYHQMFNKTYPGILMWMQLPVAQDAMQTFDKLLKSGRQLAAFLKGDLCDSKRLALTTEAIATLRERVHQFQVNNETEEELEYELEEDR